MIQQTSPPIQGPTILLQSGRYFDFTRPEDCVFDILDIAHGLSNICRFGGQCQTFYSVAQHSVYVSHLVPEEHRMSALLHDAAEAFLGDIPRPLKGLLPEYKKLEERVEWVIATRFDLAYPWSQEIKRADNAMLLAEQYQIMRNHDEWTSLQHVQAARIHISAWDPQEARKQFLDRYQFLLTAQ